MVASTGLRDTGAVASARAAEIYGLDVLAEKIQVRFPFHFCMSQAKWHISNVTWGKYVRLNYWELLITFNMLQFYIVFLY